MLHKGQTIIGFVVFLSIFIFIPVMSDANSDLTLIGDLDGPSGDLLPGSPMIEIMQNAMWPTSQQISGESVQLKQNGSQNHAYVQQSGGSNGAFHNQIGSNNTIQTYQTGQGNLTVTVQNGVGNHLVQNQIGHQLKLTVIQNGNDLKGVIKQNSM